jgi:acyl-CoA thioester hydrolase
VNVPFTGLRVVVPNEWIDVNGHMNSTHYGLAVYDAHFNFTEAIGLGEKYVNEHQCGKAVLESHMVYEREVCQGEELGLDLGFLHSTTKGCTFFMRTSHNNSLSRSLLLIGVDK